MKIAISTDGDQISAQFGRCPSFTLVNIENGQVTEKKIIDNPGHHPGFLPKYLQEQGVQYIIAGGMGQRAKMLFDEQSIATIMGISGKVDDVVQKLSAGNLVGGISLCSPGAGRGYGINKTECDHPNEDHC